MKARQQASPPREDSQRKLPLFFLSVSFFLGLFFLFYLFIFFFFGGGG